MKEKEVDLLSPPGSAPSRGEIAVLIQPPYPTRTSIVMTFSGSYFFWGR